ncbi:MAG: dihydrodipicolinate reductase, partial [Acidimicrobiia bacterium]|nr:dihydrodipicolinate reductase [Acidimicrobiia bacterium]
VREVMLFGKPPEDAAKSPMLDLLGTGFSQSVRMVADALGLAIDSELRTGHEWAVATKDLDTPVGLIPEGTVAAQRFTWEATVDREPRITARVNWLMGEDLDPPWKLGGERFEVSFDADPPLHVVFHGLHPEVVGDDLDRNRGLLATANHCVNSVPYVCDAEPGVKTYLDLPMIAGRATA